MPRGAAQATSQTCSSVRRSHFRAGAGTGRPLGRARGKRFACAAPPLATRPHPEKVRLHARSRPDAAATQAWHRNRWPLPAASPRRTAVICSDARRSDVREPLLGYNMPLRPTGFTGDPAPRPLGREIPCEGRPRRGHQMRPNAARNQSCLGHHKWPAPAAAGAFSLRRSAICMTSGASDV